MFKLISNIIYVTEYITKKNNFFMILKFCIFCFYWICFLFLSPTDFGLSNTFSKDNLMKTHCGSPEYAAPELFNPSEKYGPEIDIWSLWVPLWIFLLAFPLKALFLQLNWMICLPENGTFVYHHQKSAFHLDINTKHHLIHNLEYQHSSFLYRFLWLIFLLGRR